MPNSADDLSEIKKHLPSPQEEMKIAQEFEDLFPTTNRAGAKGIRSGLGVPAIRPRGLKAASSFIDKYTPGKYKRPKRQFSEPLPDAPANPVKRELKEKLKMMLPRTFCPDCGRTDRPPEGGAVNVNWCTEDTPALGMKAFDCYVSFFCQECLEKVISNQKNQDPADNIVVDHIHGYTNADMKGAQRLVRIKENTNAYIKARLASGDHSIYLSGTREG